MSLNRALEVNELSPDLRPIFEEVRCAFDLPFVPTIFKVAAGNSTYLREIWDDLYEVANSKEFHAAADVLTKFISAHVIGTEWRFSNQERLLTAQKFSPGDIRVMSGVAATFQRALPRMALFVRLMQRGYSGGQKGRVTARHDVAPFARMITLHIPSENEAALRTWLIYSEIKRSTGTKHVPSMFRAISPFPSYLAAVWVDMKKLFADREFLRARDEVSRRTLTLLNGFPVSDHRALMHDLRPEQWRDIEQMVDGFARLLPQFALGAAVWRRSFAAVQPQLMAG
jgi:Halocarboxylic acid dehydrogenase DehI